MALKSLLKVDRLSFSYADFYLMWATTRTTNQLTEEVEKLKEKHCNVDDDWPMHYLFGDMAQDDANQALRITNKL